MSSNVSWNSQVIMALKKFRHSPLCGCRRPVSAAWLDMNVVDENLSSGWVKRDVTTIPDENIKEAEIILAKHLSTYGPQGAEGGGLQLVGGDKWWKVRRRTLEGEWIEVRKSTLITQIKG